MRFEDLIEYVKAVTDLDKYRLTIGKGLKKLQKHYATQLRQQDATGR